MDEPIQTKAQSRDTCGVGKKRRRKYYSGAQDAGGQKQYDTLCYRPPHLVNLARRPEKPGNFIV